MPKALAILARDWQLAATYRWSRLTGLVRGLMQVVLLLFVSRLVPPERLGGATDYFTFVFAGWLAAGLSAGCLTGASAAVEFERASGTLEAVATSPTPLRFFLICKVAGVVLENIVRAVAALVVAMVFFHVRLPQARWDVAIGILALGAAGFLGLGLLSAGWALAEGEAGPVEWLLDSASRFFAGLYFPLSLFPLWVQQGAKWLPMTPLLEGTRASLIQGVAPPPATWIYLALFAAVAFPLGAWTFNRSLDRARLNGRLALH